MKTVEGTSNKQKYFCTVREVEILEMTMNRTYNPNPFYTLPVTPKSVTEPQGPFMAFGIRHGYLTDELIFHDIANTYPRFRVYSQQS